MTIFVKISSNILILEKNRKGKMFVIIITETTSNLKCTSHVLLMYLVNMNNNLQFSP
jgi:hypothetical protein